MKKKEVHREMIFQKLQKQEEQRRRE